MRRISAIAGLILVGIALLWVGWQMARQANPALNQVKFTLPGFLSSNVTPTAPTDPLVAAGITLAVPPESPQPVLNREQAILLANQIQPEAATQASSVSVAYVLFSYDGNNDATPTYVKEPAWVVHYSNIKEPRPDTSADTEATSTQHDCYVFLDADSGQQLLSIWV